MRIERFLIGVLLSIGFISCCRHDHPRNLSIKPSTEFVKMGAEGGKIEIAFHNQDWQVEKIINEDGNVSIFGNIFSEDDKLIKENEKLVLEEYGKLAAKNLTLRFL